MMRSITQKDPSRAGGDSFFMSLLRPCIFVASAFLRPLLAAAIGLFELMVQVLYLPLNALDTFTPIPALIRRACKNAEPLKHLEKEARKMEGSVEIDELQSLLLVGDRRAYAERVAPSSKHPTLYQDVPEDLARSIVQDGRLANGDAPATGLAGLSLAPEFVSKAWRSSTDVAIRVGYLVILLGLVLSIAVAAGYTKLKTDGGQLDAAPVTTIISNQDPSWLASQYRDVWSDAELNKLTAEVHVVDNSGLAGAAAGAGTRRVVEAIVLAALLIFASVLFALAAARVVWIGRFRFIVQSGVDVTVSGLRHTWREALQRWRWRLAERQIENANHNDQVHFATQIDKSPVIDIGRSLGLLEFRGHLLAPQQDQPVRMSVVDMLQHVEVLGGSGEGKTRDFLNPLLRQLLQLRKGGYPIAAYVTDDKGALVEDVREAAQAVGLDPSDLMVIGTGPNDFRVDLLEGLSPVELADIIKSVARQSGSEGGDDFWPEMASDLLLNVALILQAAERTSAGESWVRKNGIRMYSLINILRVATTDSEVELNLKIVIDAMKDISGQYASISDLDRASLRSAVDYLIDSWLGMVDATKDGIKANARKALRTFAYKEELAQGFADGAGDRLIGADELLNNKIKIVNVSQVEHGSAGRLVAIMLKTIFFKLARQSEQRDPLGAKARIKWWFNAQPGAEDATKNTLHFFIADEYQSLISASRDDGLSDASVWNVLRSAGVAGVLLSQSVSAYKMAVGDKPAENIRRNWRSKIVLRTEDLQTIEEAKKLAGRTMRFQSMDINHMESGVSVRRETGACAESLPPTQWNPAIDDIPVYFSPGSYLPFEFAGYENAFDVDERFIPTVEMNGASNQDYLNAMQAAAWRQEDRSAGAMQHGSSHEDAVHDEDIMQMGRGRALVFVQRAGGTRVEFIKLNS